MSIDFNRDLDADLAVCEAATKGPWRSQWDEDHSDEEHGEDRAAVIATKSGELIVGLMYYDGWWPGCSRENSAFITAARTGWPNALLRLKRLRELLSGAMSRDLWQEVHKLLGMEVEGMSAETRTARFSRNCSYSATRRHANESVVPASSPEKEGE